MADSDDLEALAERAVEAHLADTPFVVTPAEYRLLRNLTTSPHGEAEWDRRVHATLAAWGRTIPQRSSVVVRVSVQAPLSGSLEQEQP